MTKSSTHNLKIASDCPTHPRKKRCTASDDTFLLCFGPIAGANSLIRNYAFLQSLTVAVDIRPANELF